MDLINMNKKRKIILHNESITTDESIYIFYFDCIFLQSHTNSME